MDTAIVDTPELDLEAVDTPDVDTDTTVDTEADAGVDTTENTADTDASDEKIDGRKLPDQVRKAIKAFRDSSPDNAAGARAILDTYGSLQTYKTLFPDFAAAKSAHETLQLLENYGGTQQVQDRLNEYSEIDELLEAGDPQVLDRIAEFAGEGLNKLAPEILNRLEKSSPDAYAAAIQPIVDRSFVKTGVPQAISHLAELLDMAATASDSPALAQKFQTQAGNALKQLLTWARDVQNPKAPTQATTPDAKLSEREQALATKEQEAFTSTLRTSVEGNIDKTVSGALAPYIKTQLKNLTAEAKADLIQGIRNEIENLAKADTDYQNRIKAVMKVKQKDPSNIARLMNAKVSQVAAQAVKTVVTRRYGNGTAKAAVVKPNSATTTTTTKAGPVVKVAEKPDRKQWADYPGRADDLILGRVKLTNGKVVSWR